MTDERCRWALLLVLYASRKAGMPDDGKMPLALVGAAIKRGGLDTMTGKELQALRRRLVEGSADVSLQWLSDLFGYAASGPDDPPKEDCHVRNVTP